MHPVLLTLFSEQSKLGPKPIRGDLPTNFSGIAPSTIPSPFPPPTPVWIAPWTADGREGCLDEDRSAVVTTPFITYSLSLASSGVRGP